jgi:hypothetical protein
MMEAMSSSETSFITSGTRRNILEDAILKFHSVSNDVLSNWMFYKDVFRNVVQL